MKYLLRITAILSFVLISSSIVVGAETDSTKELQSKEPYYKIGVNDVLNIFIWNEPELTQDVTVMPDGRIIFPMIGDIMAKGSSAIELKNNITEKIKAYISSPEVTVIVKQWNSQLIYTIGKIGKPGPYPLEADMTVLQALSLAGGFAEWADTKHVMIVRRLNGNEIMFRFNYEALLSGKNLQQNLLLEPGDTIVVP